MKTIRIAIVSSLFLLSICSPAVNQVAAQESFPDFLGAHSADTDYLDESSTDGVHDPLEPMNRVFFKFNDKLYDWVLKPVTDGYSYVLPYEVRESFANFFRNLAMPVRLVNTLLQGNLRKSGVELERFLINTTLGVYGFVDVAEKEFKIEQQRADFGQTLGKWGIGEGIYLCWPIFGPSNVRDSIGFAADNFTHPVYWLSDDPVFGVSYYSTSRVNYLSLHPNIYEDLRRYSVDPYVASRQAYYEYRRELIDNE